MMAANEAVHEGDGGISRISRVCGLSRGTITKGIRELGEKPIAAGRVRRAGGGRHTLLVSDPELPRALETLVEPLARGDPQFSPALDVQEHADARGGTLPPRPSGQS